jgi:NCS1 family nucleobase:cation symporter-1
VRPTLLVRLVTITFTALLSLVAALLSSQSFLTNFNNFLLLILYLFIPWTAVNLVDYYVVRRGHYAVGEIFKPRGIYGRWGWRGVLAYAVGFGAMVPFFSTPDFTGPVAHVLNGGDVSLFVGLPVAGGIYYLLSRSIDVEAERRVAEREASEVEELASAHAVTAAEG